MKSTEQTIDDAHPLVRCLLVDREELEAIDHGLFELIARHPGYALDIKIKNLHDNIVLNLKKWGSESEDKT